MNEKKKTPPHVIILTILIIILTFISGMFIGDGIIHERNLYSTMGILIILSPIIFGIILGIFSSILEKFINNFDSSKIVEAISLPEMLGLNLFFGFFGCMVMILCFYDGGFESFRNFLKNIGWFVLFILIVWGILKIIKTIFKIGYFASFGIFILGSILIGVGISIYQYGKQDDEIYNTRRSLLDNLDDEQRDNAMFKEYLWDCDEEYGEAKPEYEDFSNKTNYEIQEEIKRLQEENWSLADKIDYYESIGCL